MLLSPPLRQAAKRNALLPLIRNTDSRYGQTARLTALPALILSSAALKSMIVGFKSERIDYDELYNYRVHSHRVEVEVGSPIHYAAFAK